MNRQPSRESACVSRVSVRSLRARPVARCSGQEYSAVHSGDGAGAVGFGERSDNRRQARPASVKTTATDAIGELSTSLCQLCWTGKPRRVYPLEHNLHFLVSSIFAELRQRCKTVAALPQKDRVQRAVDG